MTAPAFISNSEPWPPFPLGGLFLQIVLRAAGIGIPQEKICKLIINPKTGTPIDTHTLEKHFRDELDRGMVQSDFDVGNALYTNAVKHMNPAAQIWWTKSRMRWRESGDGGNANDESAYEHMSTEDMLKELAERANRLGIKIDVSID